MADRMIHVSCDLCGANNSDIELKKNGFDIVKCKNCGLVYVDPRLDEEYIKSEIYNSKFGASAEDVEYEYESDPKEQRERAEKLFKELEKEVEPGAVLDIGCSNGIILQVAEEMGWRGTGVEISEKKARFAHEELGLDILNGDLMTANLPENEYTLILMIDVLQNLSSPGAAARKAFSLLRPGGRLIAVTPNLDSTPAKVLGADWNLINPRHILYYFTPVTFDKLIRGAGFEIFNFDYPNWGLTDFISSAPAINKISAQLRRSGKKYLREAYKDQKETARKFTDWVDSNLITPLMKNQSGAMMRISAGKPMDKDDLK